MEFNYHAMDAGVKEWEYTPAESEIAEEVRWNGNDGDVAIITVIIWVFRSVARGQEQSRRELRSLPKPNIGRPKNSRNYTFFRSSKTATKNQLCLELENYHQCLWVVLDHSSTRKK